MEFLNLRMIPALPFGLVYDDEDDAAEAERVEAERVEAERVAAERAAAEKKTPAKVKLDEHQQKYVNSLLAEERRKGAAKNDQLITQLETQRNSTNTTAAEKVALEERIESLRNEYQSKEQVTQKTTAKKIKDLEGEVTTAKQTAEKWQKLFQGDRINNALLSAATEHKAYNPQQVVTQLKENTRLVEALDGDNKPIPDQWVERVKITGRDKDGKSINLELTATEAVKQLTEMPEYGNLFVSGATGGIGSNSLASRGGGNNADTPPTDTAAYMQWRAERKKKGLPV